MAIPTMTDLSPALAAVDDTLPASLERLYELLRIPSISADPAYRDDCRRAAEWAAAALSEIGFEASVRPDEGHPMVVGHWRSGRPGARRVLFYGHYDVQPADPLELWTSPPFEPRLVDGADGQKIVARGSSDDKGQLMTFVEACRAMLETTGGLPLDVTIFLEGEEESSSLSLVPFLTANKDELAADICLVCDTDMWNRDTPAIITMLRGMVYQEVTIKAASMDLHSGMYGGAARNPIHVLARILAALHDEDGRVTLPGFYEGVLELSDETQARLGGARLRRRRLSRRGRAVASRPARRAAPSSSRSRSRPTCDVNGIVGGYTGQGAKTVIPAQASRQGLLPPCRQAGSRRGPGSPSGVSSRERLPADCKASFLDAWQQPCHRRSLRQRATSPGPRGAWRPNGAGPAPTIGSGGSIPVVGELQRILGIDSLLIGFALDDDRIHSPNEKYELRSFHKGIRSWIRILDALGR